MSVRSISLRKLIKILFSPASHRVSGIKKDTHKDMKRSQDAATGGFDRLAYVLKIKFANINLFIYNKIGGRSDFCH